VTCDCSVVTLREKEERTNNDDKTSENEAD